MRVILCGLAIIGCPPYFIASVQSGDMGAAAIAGGMFLAACVGLYTAWQKFSAAR